MNKYQYVKVIQARYNDGPYGWEDESTYDVDDQTGRVSTSLQRHQCQRPSYQPTHTQ